MARDYYTDTDAFPHFTSKQELLQELYELSGRCPDLADICIRLTQTDTTGFTDGATIFSPDDSYENAEE